jgi:hypothetical protein
MQQTNKINYGIYAIYTLYINSIYILCKNQKHLLDETKLANKKALYAFGKIKMIKERQNKIMQFLIINTKYYEMDNKNDFQLYANKK